MCWLEDVQQVPLIKANPSIARRTVQSASPDSSGSTSPGSASPTMHVDDFQKRRCNEKNHAARDKETRKSDSSKFQNKMSTAEYKVRQNLFIQCGVAKYPAQFVNWFTNLLSYIE